MFGKVLAFLILVTGSLAAPVDAQPAPLLKPADQEIVQGICGQIMGIWSEMSFTLAVKMR
jgi:hypothetical protein